MPSRLQLLLLFALAALFGPDTRAATDPHPTGELVVRVLDTATGQPVPATVTLTDARGQRVTRGAGLRDAFRTSGVFTQSVAAGTARLRITRGPEYAAIGSTVEIPADGQATLEASLTRRIDLRARGWFATDHHAHMLHGERTVPVSFADLALAAQAEDLQMLSVAQAWAIDAPTPERLDAELALHSVPAHRLAWNLEAPKNYFLGDAARCLGHCWTLGLRGRTPEGADVIARLLQASAWDYESHKPPVANFESHALIRAQDGAVFYTHPARWWTGAWGGQGGYPHQAAMRVSNMAVELPLDVLAGPTFDGLDLITGSGEAAADEKAFQLWALLLNHGYRLSGTASSDACFDRPSGATPGAARLYLHTLGEPTPAALRDAAVRGRTFATTGPLLLVSLDGLPPGTALPGSERHHTLSIEAWASGISTGGLSRIEILRNGASLRTFELPDRPVAFARKLELPGTTAGSAWYCVRAFGADPRRDRAISGAFHVDAVLWIPPAPVRARVEARVIDAQTGRPIPAVLRVVEYRGATPVDAETPPVLHRAPEGSLRVEIPATTRLRAEAEGYRPVTLSPFFDHPELLETITRMDDRALLDWATFERIRQLLGQTRLTFRLEAQAPG